MNLLVSQGPQQPGTGLARVVTPAACDPALVGKSTDDLGASAVVKVLADLLTRDGVSDVSTRLGGDGTTGSVWLGGGCGTWDDGSPVPSSAVQETAASGRKRLLVEGGDEWEVPLDHHHPPKQRHQSRQIETHYLKLWYRVGWGPRSDSSSTTMLPCGQPGGAGVV